MIHDISVPLTPDMIVWPGDRPAQFEVEHPAGDATVSVTRLACSAHTGTHIDAPRHFVPGATTVDQLDPGLAIGPAWVARLGGTSDVTAADLQNAGVPAGVTRLLLRTANTDRCIMASPVFRTDYVALTADAADWIVGRGIRCVGIDCLSVDTAASTTYECHRALLGAGVVVLEGCSLCGIDAGAYSLVCAPLRIAGADGSPVRALLIDP